MSEMLKTTAVQSRKSNSAICFLVLLSIFLKPFYILPSGSFQLSDAVLTLAAVFALFSAGLNFRIEKIDAALILFVLLALLINTVYFSTTGSSSFLTYSSYYIFTLMAVLLFRTLIYDRIFLRKLIIVLRVCLAIQLLVMLIGFGRWYDGTRYMGTFNDPNQFAVFVFFAFLIIKTVLLKLGKKNKILDDILVFALILVTASTGLLLSLAVYYFCTLLFQIHRAGGDRRLILQTVILYSVLAIVTILVFINYASLLELLSQLPIGDRLSEKLNKIIYGTTAAGTSDFFADRQLSRIFSYPQYFIFGSGEGDWSRFLSVDRAQEMHSTWIGLAFYYGIIPFICLLTWVCKNTKNAYKDGSWTIFIPLILEAMMLANQRQPLFWMLIMLVGISLFNNNGDIAGNIETGDTFKRQNKWN